jgi:hypothetical protein
VALLSPRLKLRLVAGGAAALLAFAVGLLVAVFGALAADAEQAGPHSVRGQPTAQQFAPPNQPDVSDSDARAVDALYRLLIIPPPTSSASLPSTRLRAAPSDDAAGGVRRWTSPR